MSAKKTHMKRSQSHAEWNQASPPHFIGLLLPKCTFEPYPLPGRHPVRTVDGGPVQVRAGRNLFSGRPVLGGCAGARARRPNGDRFRGTIPEDRPCPRP